MKVLVIGGTGTVGSRVTNQLLQQGCKVRILSRQPDSTRCRVPAGAEVVAGDLRDPYTARGAFENTDAVFMLNGASTSETYEGVMGVLLASRAKVRRFVYMSSHKIELTAFLPIGGATKLPVENALKISGMSFTIVRPNNFFQNDLWYKDSMLNTGIYPQPIGFKGMSRVDVRDIAEVATIALLKDGHEGKTYNVTGPEIQTGPSTAEAWSAALGCPVRYAGNDMEAFERAHAFMGGGLVFPYRLFYEFYQEHGLLADPGDVETLTSLLGRPPRTLAAFALETAQAWRQSGG